MRMSLLRLAALAALAFASTGTAHAQDAQDKPAKGQTAPDQIAPARDTIIVQGEYDAVPLASPLPGMGAKASRSATSDARMFVRCIHHAPARLLRPIVEGHASDPGTQDALDRVIRTNPGCYHGYFSSPVPSSPYYGTCNPVVLGNATMCRSTYDRGALVEDAFNTYAPKFMLMRGDTLNKDVIARFRAREAARGKFRTPIDRRFYETVACMVQMEPERAVRLLRAEPGLERETRYRAQMIARTPYCSGNAKRVRVDPYQFRAYLADAVYHWTVAAKGLDTLIPAS